VRRLPPCDQAEDDRERGSGEWSRASKRKSQGGPPEAVILGCIQEDDHVELEDAIRSRRTHKAYRPEPVDRATLDELFELARWAPNHHLTNPWRFRVLGPRALQRLKDAADALESGSGHKLERAPTLVAATVEQTGDPVQDREDLVAGAVAAYIVLLGAHARSLAGYWRTPAVLRDPGGRRALGIGDGEEVLGLLHIGYPRQEQPPPVRASVSDVVDDLD
jgi:nitroreductase